ncbi:MAG: hypothetical protein ABI175_19620 [Polyangiales bacterium]
MNSIELPAESVVQAAVATAQSKKSGLAAMFWLDGIFALSPLALLGSYRGDKAQLAFGLGFWILVCGLITLRIWRRLRTARNAETAAKTNPALTWRLNGRQVVAVNERGIPQADLSFKISSSMRDILTAVPEARVIQR